MFRKRTSISIFKKRTTIQIIVDKVSIILRKYIIFQIIGEDTELFTVTHDAANNLKDRLLKRRHVNRFDRKLSAGCTFLKPKSYTQKKIHHVPSVTKTEAI